jgi:ribonuclease HII
LNNLIEFDSSYLSQSVNSIAGIDEAGRGPLAGPVIAAAVMFEKGTFIEGVNDSKKLNQNKREYLAKVIKEKAICYSYGIVDQAQIDEINILRATLKAMKSSLSKLKIKPDLVLIDGNKSFKSRHRIELIIKGDQKSFSIAAASILAKVKRDEIMKKASLRFPHYNWHKNKGYGTSEHIEAIKKHGYTELHRRTFLRNILTPEMQGKLL